MIESTPPGAGTRTVMEAFRPGTPGCWVHPEWESRFPWLAQGTTGGWTYKGAESLDFALFTGGPGTGGRASWKLLASRMGFGTVVHSRQVHGREVLVHPLDGGDDEAPVRGDPTLTLTPDADGHVTRASGTLLGITVADCVPVFLVNSETRGVGLLHAGWRGVVAGILEAGIKALTAECGSAPGSLFVHLGPAICGSCYEVGGEVHTALGRPDPGGPKPVDLRKELAERTMAMGVPAPRVTRSGWCTLCEGSPFFSHRRGDKERQVGFLGLRWLDSAGAGIVGASP